MKITITQSEAEFDTQAAGRIIDEISRNSKAVVALSTGRTTKNMHLLAGEMYKQNPFDISGVTFLGIDEVIHVPRKYAGACYTMLKTQLIDTLGVDEDHFIMPPTMSDDFETECRRFQQKIDERGGIDLLILGLGENGHLGFNQPGTPFDSETHIAKMNKALEARIRQETNIPGHQELGGITLGIKNIMQARKIILVAKGVSKAGIVKQMLHGPVTIDNPSSILRSHPNIEFLLNNESAGLLPN